MCCAGRHLRADLFGARRVRSRRAPWAQHARVTEVAGMSYLTEDDVARLLALPRPDTAAMVDLDDSTRKAIENRVSALTALIEGEPVKRVRSEERRVGEEWVSTCRSRWTPYH